MIYQTAAGIKHVSVVLQALKLTSCLAGEFHTVPLPKTAVAILLLSTLLY